MQDSQNYFNALQEAGISNATDIAKKGASEVYGNIVQPISDLLIAGGLKSLVSSTVPMIGNLVKANLAKAAAKAAPKEAEAEAGAEEGGEEGLTETSEGIEMTTFSSSVVPEVADVADVAAESGGLVNFLSGAVSTVASGVQSLATTVASSFGGQIGDVATQVAGIAGQVAGASETIATGGLEGAASVANAALQSSGVLANVGSAVEGQITNGANWLASSVAPALENTVAATSDIASGVTNAVAPVLSNTVSAVSGAAETAAATTTEAVATTAEVAATTSEAIATTAETAAVAGTGAVASGLTATGVLAPIGLLVGVVGSIVAGLDSAGDFAKKVNVLNPAQQFL
jgi:hypothetical protein